MLVDIYLIIRQLQAAQKAEFTKRYGACIMAEQICQFAYLKKYAYIGHEHKNLYRMEQDKDPIAEKEQKADRLGNAINLHLDLERLFKLYSFRLQSPEDYAKETAQAVANWLKNESTYDEKYGTQTVVD